MPPSRRRIWSNWDRMPDGSVRQASILSHNLPSNIHARIFRTSIGKFRIQIWSSKTQRVAEVKGLWSESGARQIALRYAQDREWLTQQGLLPQEETECTSEK